MPRGEVSWAGAGVATESERLEAVISEGQRAQPAQKVKESGR
jgi:hypothetical protein